MPLMSLAACDRPEYYRSFARAVVADAKEAGYNGTWNPKGTTEIDHVPRRLFAYLIPDSQLHAIEVLAGKLPAKGKLPYKMSFK